MDGDTKGFVMTEMKDPFEVFFKISEALEGLICADKPEGEAGFRFLQTEKEGKRQYALPKCELNDTFKSATILFKYRGEDRWLRVHFDRDQDGEAYGYKDGSKLILSLGCWGSSVELMITVLKALAVYGPAYLIDNDCSDYELQEIFSENR